MTKTVAYQGEPGSFSEEAVWRHFANEATGRPYATFEEAVEAVVQEEADLVLLPIESTLTGPFRGAVEAAQQAGLEQRSTFSMPTELCIIGQPDASLEHVHRAYSQAEALDQCKSILETLGLEPHETRDTAGAVREVKERGDPAEAAIASARAAAQHGMKVLAREVQDPGAGRIRYGLFGRAL